MLAVRCVRVDLHILGTDKGTPRPFYRTQAPVDPFVVQKRRPLKGYEYFLFETFGRLNS